MKIQQKVAASIGLISVTLSIVFGAVTWFNSKEAAESLMVSLATEESKKIIDKLEKNNTFELDSTVKTMTGGLYDIAEIYNSNGQKLVESVTNTGAVLEKQLPKHNNHVRIKESYESIHLNDQWIIRVFVPLHKNNSYIGTFEGIRIIPEWQQQEITHQALFSSTIAALSALLCGLIIFPVVRRLSHENEKKTKAIIESHVAMMEALGRAIAKRDSETGAHNYRVALISASIAEKLNLSTSEMQSLIAGSFLHDVGKIGIPDEILLKPGKLTEDEFKIMKTHVLLGTDIVSDVGFLNQARTVVDSHHEKWNGSGYPYGLKETEIPLFARIFAVADVFDALTSERPYKKPFSYEETMSILEKDSGTHFDPEIIKIFKDISHGLYNDVTSLSELDAKQKLREKILEHFNV